jgi:hypothetical protein
VPPLADGYGLPSAHRHKVGRRVYRPSGNIAVFYEVLECRPQGLPKPFEFCCLAAAQFPQRRHLYREGRGVAGKVKLKPTRKVFAFEVLALFPID